MYGIYGDIIDAAERAIEDFRETEELLEYPEVQADKAYYLSVLAKYNELKLVKDKLTALKQTLKEEEELSLLSADTLSEEERAAVYEEISSLKRRASVLSVAISNALGCRHVSERAYCRFKLTKATSRFGVQLCALIKDDLLSRGAKIENEGSERAREGHISEISFYAEGEDILTRLAPLSGAHRVYLAGGKSEELCFAVTSASSPQKISESDLKIDVFHSSGAGGQNVNKVETAVRITHLPTGVTVVCQDERSQLKNKKRALATLEKRLFERHEEAEKKRIEADIYAQYRRKNTPISFMLDSATMTDTRLKGYTDIPFPFTDFSSYLNGLIVI